MREVVPQRPDFDIATAPNLSFAVLEDARTQVYDTESHLLAFRRQVNAMSTSGEEGRRRGLGLWILAEYAACAEALAAYSSDDTASFTRARALFSLGRAAEAATIFERLTKAYPAEPRPRAGWLEARLEAELEETNADELAQRLQVEVDRAPEGFSSSAEGAYVAARIAELRRDWNAALGHYEAGARHESVPRSLLFRYAHLAERNGLDELAIAVYERLVSRPPRDRSVLMNLGLLYEDVGKNDEAAACYHTVVRHDGADDRARLFLGDARASMTMYYDEDLEKKEDRLNQILRIPITDFELSVRARNCLNKMQITTLGDLVQRTEQELLSYKNFGETSLTEIKEILHSKALRLGMPREEAVASIEAHAERASSGERTDVLNKPILELQLSIRARRTVETLGCLTLGDCTKHSAEELLGMPNFGQTSLQELRSKLAEYGLKLKGE